MSSNSIWPIDRTFPGATSLDQSRPRSDGNEGRLHLPQSLNFNGASSSACLMSYPGCSLGESYLSVETQSLYSMVPADWTGGTRPISYGIPFEHRKKRQKLFCFFVLDSGIPQASENIRDPHPIEERIRWNSISKSYLLGFTAVQHLLDNLMPKSLFFKHLNISNYNRL